MANSENLRLKFLAGLITENEFKKSTGDQDLDDLEIEDSFYYKYNSFGKYLDSEFGSGLTDSELVEAIKGWAESYNIGENPGDFEGVAEVVTPQIMSQLEASGISDAFMSELKEKINSQEKETLNSVNINETIIAGKRRSEIIK